MAATVSDLQTMVYSGDFRADALLDSPAVWNYLVDGRNVLYFTFDASAGSVADVETTQRITAFNTTQKQAARAILQYVATVTGIVFSEVASSAQADLHFVAADLQGASTAGLASSFYNYSYQGNGTLTQLTAESVIYLDNVEQFSINNSPVVGSAGYEILLHEVGHALGLSHPFDSPKPLPSSLDNTNNTVMSYTWQGAYKTQFQSYDLLALDWLYGRDGLGGSKGFNSTGGPTLVFSAQTLNWTGTALNDVFPSTAGNEALNGAGGVDTVVYRGNRSEYTLAQRATGWQVTDSVSSRDGTDTLEQVERLKFADRSVALDLSGAAGTAARLLGVVTGAPSLAAHPEWVGAVLAALDSGVSPVQAASLALKAVLGAAPTHTQVVNLLYTNLFDAAPAAATLQSLTSALSSGAYTQASLTQAAADLAANAAHIDLVGLSAGGLVFI